MTTAIAVYAARAISRAVTPARPIFFDSWGNPHEVCGPCEDGAAAFGPQWVSRPVRLVLVFARQIPAGLLSEAQRASRERDPDAVVPLPVPKLTVFRELGLVDEADEDWTYVRPHS